MSGRPSILRETVLPLAEAAKRLGVTYRTAKRWTERPRKDAAVLEATRIGGRLYTSVEALERFAEPTVKSEQRVPVHLTAAERSVVREVCTMLGLPVNE